MIGVPFDPNISATCGNKIEVQKVNSPPSLWSLTKEFVLCLIMLHHLRFEVKTGLY